MRNEDCKGVPLYWETPWGIDDDIPLEQEKYRRYPVVINPEKKKIE